VDAPSGAPADYIRIDFVYSAHKPPKKLVQVKRLWRFQLIRTSEHDEKIEEFIRGHDVYNREIKKPIWKPVRGAEKVHLPFGEVLRSYSLSKNGFKATTSNQKR
jgi:hypothetical protein